MLGGDAVGRNIDALHLLARDGLVVEQANEGLDRRLDVPAAGVGLDVAIGDAERGRGRQGDSARRRARFRRVSGARTFRVRLVGAAEGEGLHEAVARLDHVGRAFDALFREQCGLQALAGGVAGMQPLDVAAAIDEGEQPRGARGGEPERVRERVG